MSHIASLLSSLRAWSEPNPASGDNPFQLACKISEPASEQEISSAWPGKDLPEDILEAWTTCREARIFEDVDYGQWGLRILSPEESAARTRSEQESRPSEFTSADIIFAEFLGDQDLLVRSRTNDGNDEVFVAMPLDARQDWYRVGQSIEEFLEHYIAADGGKYWETLSA